MEFIINNVGIISSVLLVIIVVLGPRLIVLLADKVKPLGFLGPIFLCYVLGLACSFGYKALGWDTSLAMTIAEVMVPIAIPLILFSANLTSLKRLAKPMMLSFILVTVSVVVVSSAVFFLWGDRVEDAAGLSGMLIGLYTGGTPNLMAIGKALSVQDNAIALANASDVVVGGAYFLILIALGPMVAKYSKFITEVVTDEKLQSELSERFSGKKQKASIKSIVKSVPVFLLAVLCLAIGAGLSILITGELTNIVVIMLVVTTLGIAFSFVKPVRKAPNTFSMGQYLIYMFSVGIGFSLDLSAIDSSALMILAYVAAVQFASIALHYILAAICRIDMPTTMITSVAGVFGPAFIVPVANSMKNRDVVLPGLICGILGYAIGNYIGIGVAMLLGLFA
ncbi:MAG: DUF819 family protein [Clostridia bacterium]|nr:DUF819 family protein [Clostridia bacterium]